MWKVLAVAWFVGGICSSVVSCPQHCQCFLDEGLRTANCSGSALITHQLPSQIDVLNVRPHYNGFRTKLSERGFKAFKNIKFLNLSNTSISIIPDQVFHGLNYIITIDLSLNKIKHLNGGTFKELSTLQTLLLRGNPLMLTQLDVIVSKSLRKLDMGSCGLRTIPAGTFSHVPSLTALFLDGNSLQTLGYQSLPPGLWYLNLANNQIVNVPTDILHTLKSLTRIDMSGNPVKCTCHLLLLQDTFSGQGRTFENGIICSGPRQFNGQKLSQINENELCNLEFIRKVRFMNSIKHYRDVRSYRKHNMIKPPYDDTFGIQGDQPLNDDLAPTHDSEVMFANEETRSMGTHMANSLSSHVPSRLDISDENNKLLSPLATDPSSSEGEHDKLENKEESLEMLHHSGEIVEKMFDSVDASSASSNRNPEMLLVEHETGVDLIGAELSSTTEQISSKAEINKESIGTDGHSPTSSEAYELTVESKESVPDMINHSLLGDATIQHETATDSGHVDHDVRGLAELTLVDSEEQTSPAPEQIITNDAHSITEHNITSTLHEDEINVSLDDVEELSNESFTFTGETLSRYSELSHWHSLFPNDSTEIPHKIETYTFPTSKADLSDYNYDAQHDPDYSSIEPWLGGKRTTEADPYVSLTTETHSTEEKAPKEDTSLPETVFVEQEEGSGDSMNQTVDEDQETTVPWLEEQENETTTAELYVENDAELFNITSGESLRLSHYTQENASVSEFEMSSTEEVTTQNPEIGSSSTSETVSGEEIEDTATTEEITEVTTPESTSESITLEAGTEISSSSGDNYTLQMYTTEVATTEETTLESSSASVPLSIQEISSTESSTSADVFSSSFSYSPSSEPTPEHTAHVTSEESTTEGITETSTDSSSSTVPLLPIIEIKEKSEDFSSSSAPVSSEVTLDVSSSADLDILIQSTTETYVGSVTPVSEVEFVSKAILVDEKENIILDPSQEEASATEVGKSVELDMTIIGIIALIVLVVLIIIVISLTLVCRRTNRPRNKVRLPADPEANQGTEMQDMLLPKPPENGVKVLPKNYTNGTTTANGKTEQKEEETPVLAAAAAEEAAEPEPDRDWEGKPEPIETVTARLSMLARPQTPVFIANTLN